MSAFFRIALAVAAAALIGGIASLLGAPEAPALLAAAAGGAAGWGLTRRREPPPAAEPAPAIDAAPAPSLAALLDAVDEPLLLVAGQRVTHANAAALRLLGAHIVGEDVRIAIRHPAAAEHLARDTDAAARIALAGLGETDRRWTLSVHPLDAAHRLVRLVDRSAEHAAERMRVDFVANASHELRTPLATILGFIEALEDREAGGDRATRHRFLGIMQREAQRMQRLLDDLMSLSRIEADRHSPPRTPLDLALLAGEVRDAIAGGLPEPARVMLEIAPETPQIAGDRAQISQLLHNLVGNALKYGGDDRPVRIALAPAPRTQARLTIVDEGEGIAPEHLPRLTERFYRADAGRSRGLGGTGLGLAIVKHIVERHRGRLEITSTLGIGTTVTVLLPAIEP